jgi:isochorismate synthase
MLISQSTRRDVAETAHQTLEKLWTTALKSNMAVAVWRLPATGTRHIIVDLSGEVQQVKLDLEESPAGFAVSPFLNEGMKHTRFIKADVYYNTTKDSDSWKQQAVNGGGGEDFIKLFEASNSTAGFVVPQYPLNEYLQTSEINFRRKNNYTSLVERALAEIQSGHFQKVVLSRRKEVVLPEGFDILKVFDKLCVEYPQAFVSLFYLPNEGMWLGASPEVLVSIDDQQIFRTMSLAGTQPRAPHQSACDAAWTQKEIEEQAMVSRYIINCFKKIRLREYEEKGPRTVTAGNVMHLRTDYAVDMKAAGFPQLGTVMLDLLHPTSAVCGMPKEAALKFIKEEEGYNRKFYSGFLGPVNIGSASALFVNLRCMEIEGGKASLYAGAGVIEGSDPEKEWNETEIKCQTLLNKIINSNN